MRTPRPGAGKGEVLARVHGAPLRGERKWRGGGGREVCAAIKRAPDAARRRADEDDFRIEWRDGDGVDAPARQTPVIGEGGSGRRRPDRLPSGRGREHFVFAAVCLRARARFPSEPTALCRQSVERVHALEHEPLLALLDLLAVLIIALKPRARLVEMFALAALASGRPVALRLPARGDRKST